MSTTTRPRSPFIALALAAAGILTWIGLEPLRVSAQQPAVTAPNYNSPYTGPLFRGTTPRFHNYMYQHPLPPATQPDSYIYYRRGPYYSNFAPPYAYPYALPYYAPGVTPQVAPDIYPNYPRQWH